MKIKHLLLIVLCGLVAINTSAQINPFLGFTGLEMTNTVPNPNQCFSVGDVPLLINVRAKLHVNSFGLAASTTGVGPGQMFRTDGPNGFVNSWTMYTGPTAVATNEKFSVFTTTGLGLINNLNNITLQATQRDMVFNTGGPFECTRMIGVSRIFSPANPVTTYPVTAGNVGIGTSNPCVMLQIGGDVTVSGGYRDWMNVGTYYQRGSDNMYIGHKNLPSTSSSAVINWGNNPTAGGPDRLLFVFTASIPVVQTLTAQGVNGLEMARMITNGNIGRIGFGGDPATNLYFTGSADPQNTVEINSFGLVTTPGGSSGLKFTDLNSTSPTIANPGIGVLSVDATGDVIYVPGVPGSNFFALCNTLPAQNSGFGTLLQGANFFIDGNGSLSNTDNSVIIGNSCTYTPLGKLDVLQKSGTSATIGIYVDNDDAPTVTAPSIGIKAITTMPATGSSNVAGWFEAIGAAPNINNYALFVPPLGGIASIGYTFGAFNPLVGPNLVLQVNGNANIGGVFYGSDIYYKNNISTITNALDKIMSIDGVYYYYDTINNPNMNFETDRQVGFIAQNIDSILPEVISIDANGKKTLDYPRMLALYAQALKELNNKVDTLSQNNLRISNSSSNNINVNLESDVILYQNYPNPFNGETVIKYYIPTNINSAKMLFMDETGRLIKEVDITTTGDGQVTVNTQDLASGIYTYSLQVNGKNIQTRKMQKVN